MKKLFFPSIGTVLSLIIASCSPPRPPSAYDVEILKPTTTTARAVETEIVDQPNCQGASDTDYEIQKSKSISHSAELGLGLVVDAEGKLELFGTGINLGAAFSDEFGYQYGETEAISRSLTVRAAPHTHMKHTVALNEVWETGIVRVTSNGQSLDIPFEFRTSFSITLIESISLSCGTETGQPTGSPATAILTPSDPSLGMHVSLHPSQTSGNRPLQVTFDARDSFFIAPDGTRFDCGACNYFWEVRKDGQNLFGPNQEDGNFVYTFGARGTYYVSVYVCRSGSTAITDCGGSGVQIVVQ